MMRIGGFVRQSLSDYPGKVACVVYTTGCNFKCPYCHNSQLVNEEIEKIPEKAILDYCLRNKNILDAMVITGGEPTIQSNLIEFVRQIRSVGLSIQLETNGSNPGILAELIEDRLIDYLSMDIKSAFTLEAYTKASGILMTSHQMESIIKSVHLILESLIPHEFRTTVCKELVTPSDLHAIIAEINGCDRYFLQKIDTEYTLRDDARQYTPYSDMEIGEIIARVPVGFPIYYRS